jgi:hypothetical protein
MNDHIQQPPLQGERAPRRRLHGFTLVSLAVSVAASGILLASGWISYASMLRQWKIGSAERVMDQYAASVMQELTNDVSWAWAAEPQGSSRWRFQFDDLIDENPASSASSPMMALRDANKFVTISYNPTQGILVRGQTPKWAGDIYHPQYKFVGSSPHMNETRAMDRRDRMTVEALAFDWNLEDQGVFRTTSLEDVQRRKGLVKVTLTMHYTYRGNGGLGLYADYYTRERIYTTQIFMKNWDTEGNAYRDSLVKHAR